MPKNQTSQFAPTETDKGVFVNGTILKFGLRSEMVTSSEGHSHLKLQDGAPFVAPSEQGHMNGKIVTEKKRAGEQELKINQSKLWIDSNCSDSSMSHSNSTDTMPSSFFPSSCSGPQPTSDVHSFPDSPEFSTSIISPESYPEKYKLPHYAGFIICSNSEPDKNMAKNFKLLVEKFLKLDDECTPRICMIDEDDGLETIQSWFLKVQEAMNRSTLIFLLVTEDFVKERWADIQKEEALKLSITKPDRHHSVIPLHTVPKENRQYEYPFGLHGIRGLDLWKMLKKHDLREVDVNKIELSDLDEDFCKRLTSLFNRWLSHKQKQQKQQEEELSKWIEEEEKRRWRCLATCGHPNNEKTKQLIEKMQKGGISASSAARAVATEGLIDIKNEGNLQFGTNNVLRANMAEHASTHNV